MSIIVRVSYQTPSELEVIRLRLKDILPHLEIAEEGGRYSRAYLKEQKHPERKNKYCDRT